MSYVLLVVFFFQAEDGIRDVAVTGVQTCALPISEADGDFEKAIEILRKKGQKVSASRSDRDAKEGSVFVKVSRSEVHTSELQSRLHLVCRLLLEKKKKKKY